MKKIFTILLASTLAVPAFAAKVKVNLYEAKVDVIAGTNVYSPVKSETPYTYVQEVSYDEATDSYVINDFLGYKKFNFTFKVENPATPESFAPDRKLVVVKSKYGSADNPSNLTEREDYTWTSIDNSQFSSYFLEDYPAGMGVRMGPRTNSVYRFREEYRSAPFTGNGPDRKIAQPYFYHNNDDKDPRLERTHALVDGDNYTVNMFAFIYGGDYLVNGEWEWREKDASEAEQENLDYYDWNRPMYLTLEFGKGLQGGDIQEDPEPSEGTHTFSLYTMVSDFYTTSSTGTSQFKFNKPGEKLGSAKGNITSVEEDGVTTYTIENLFGYSNGDFIFQVNPKDMGHYNNSGSTLKNPIVDLVGEDRKQIIQTFIKPAFTTTLGELSTRWYPNIQNTWYLFGEDSQTVTEVYTAQNIVPASVPNEAAYRTFAFTGGDTDYMFLNPVIQINTATNVSGNGGTPQTCVREKTYFLEKDGTKALYLAIRPSATLTKAAGASEWTLDEDNNITYYVVCNIEGDADAGVAEIEIDENAPVEYYNLQGIRVENPTAGLYIRRQGKNVQKIVIR